MKNKKFTYFVLIPAVLIIWGIIIYRISVKDDDFSVYEVNSNTPTIEKTGLENDVYQLINNYSDPFLVAPKPMAEAKKSNVEVYAKSKLENTWPDIRFNGYILNAKEVRGHLNINNEDKILQVHEVFLENYVVSAITPDSVQIRCKGESKWFKK